jgi:hypothetical protein
MKKCFKCNQLFNLSEFYKHSKMPDGHLNKCKSCTKLDVENRRKEKSNDIDWVLSERKRHREKSKRYRELGIISKNNASQKKWALNNLEKKQAHQLLRSALELGKLHRHPCFICGNKAQAHHDDYSKPLDVVWVCSKHHGEIHVKINEKKLRESFSNSNK